jgi:hypothetical protein
VMLVAMIVSTRVFVVAPRRFEMRNATFGRRRLWFLLLVQPPPWRGYSVPWAQSPPLPAPSCGGRRTRHNVAHFFLQPRNTDRYPGAPYVLNRRREREQRPRRVKFVIWSRRCAMR